MQYWLTDVLDANCFDIIPVLLQEVLQKVERKGVKREIRGHDKGGKPLRLKMDKGGQEKQQRMEWQVFQKQEAKQRLQQ